MNTPQVPNFRKADLVLFRNIPVIVMAKLQWVGTNPPSYNICNASDLKWSQHGVSLEGAIHLPLEDITDDFRRRAANFL